MEFRLRPARDLQLPPGERIRSVSRERSIGGLAINTAWRMGVRAYLRLFHRLRVTGIENLPTAAPFVMVANHASHLDALVLAASLRGAPARHAMALAAADTFFSDTAVSAFAAYAVNALPVSRKRGPQSAMITLRDRLVEDGLVYLLFPEGTRSRTGEMARFRPGLGLLLAGTEVPLVPCWIEGAFAAWPAESKWPRRKDVSVRIGPPLQFASLPNTAAGWVQVAAQAEAAVRTLAPA